MSITILPNDNKSRLARIGQTGPDTPITLKDACQLHFSGTISVATLKAEHGRGNLVIFKVGRQYFTTLNELNAMMEKCRLEAPPGVRNNGRTEAERRKPVRSGQSSTARLASAQAAALEKNAQCRRSLRQRRRNTNCATACTES